MCGEGGQDWSPDCIRSANLWTDRMNGAVVSADSDGLRVTVAPGRKWAIAAIPNILLPRDAGRIRLKVRSVEGGAVLLMRLYGDAWGYGRPVTVSIFEKNGVTGEFEAEPDPRAMAAAGRAAFQVQLGVEGEPGAAVVFESLEFIPGRTTKTAAVKPGQTNIDCVDWMPNYPYPFKMRDWRAVARAYDALAFNHNARGLYLPLIWIDDSRVNIPGPTFGIYSYVGDLRQGGANHEGVTGIAAVLSGTLVGIDKRKQRYDYVAMCEAYYNRKNGLNLVLNGMEQETGGSFWYELWPHILFYCLADKYPGHGNLDEIMKTTADRWNEACLHMTGSDGKPDFNHTSFDFRTLKPVDNGQWREPDAAAGIGWLEYMAWVRFRDDRHLKAADSCLRFLSERRENPYYEVLLPYGAYLAARMNAELGRDYDLDKMINWSFGISECRSGWGITIQKWGGHDCHGLAGSVDNGGGYAFAMNTFAQAGAMTPIVRYAPCYSRAIGKWMLNLANAARLFCTNGLPPDRQSCSFWKGDPKGVIAYEGLRRQWGVKSPYATGDPLCMKWGPKTDLGLYGSSHVGMLGALVHPTSDGRIIALDCLATDFFHDKAFPTFLIYNPYAEDRTISLELGKLKSDVYDAASKRILLRKAAGKTDLMIPADNAKLIVIVPSDGEWRLDGRKLRVNDVIIDYDARALPR